MYAYSFQLILDDVGRLINLRILGGYIYLIIIIFNFREAAREIIGGGAYKRCILKRE